MKKKQYAAQASIEFIGGFFLFIIVVGYVAFSTINTVPSYMESVNENSMRIKTWGMSEAFLKIVAAGGRIDDAKLADFKGCRGYNYNDPASVGNYTLVKALLNVSEENNVHITLEQFPVAVLDSGDNSLRSGTLDIDGVIYGIEARNTSLMFNETRVNGGNWLFAGNKTDISGENYTVADINPLGDFVIFKRKVIDCGP